MSALAALRSDFAGRVAGLDAWFGVLAAVACGVRAQTPASWYTKTSGVINLKRPGRVCPAAGNWPLECAHYPFYLSEHSAPS